MEKGKNHMPVYVNFTTDQHTALKEHAEKKGLRLSQYVRSELVKIYNRIETKNNEH